MSQNNHAFEINELINPETKEPFGEQFSGKFNVRRPTIKDNANIALAFSSATSKGGALGMTAMSSPAVSQLYIFCMIDTIATEKPKWFDSSTMYEDDEAAVYAVHDEVDRWLATFRRETRSTTSSTGSGDAPVLVSDKI
jgi:hypothetical protein